jgi:hypothetical protein
MNGYNKNRDTFRKNDRVAEIQVATSEDERFELHLSDKGGWQRFKGPVKPAHWIALHIARVYPGEKFKDTALSGLRFE